MATEIGIFCVGQTKVDKVEVRRWLNFIGADAFVIPEDGAVSNPALLIALAGKRCYKSFVEGLNPNISRIRKEYADYFDNILASGHGSVLEHSVFNFAFENVSRVFCYHPETEVLTAHGWKPVAAVKAGEIVLTLNPATGRARWSVNRAMHSFEYSGPLYYWRNREDASPKVTPDHTLWCCPVDLRKVRGMKAAEAVREHGRKERFADMLGKRFFVQNAIGQIDGVLDPAHVGIGEHTYPAEEIMEWLGWVATDGTIVKPETRRSRVRVNQSKPAGVRRLRELRAILFGDRCRVTGDRYKAFDVSDPAFYAWCVELIGRTNEERHLLPLLRYSPRLVKAFLRGMYGGDGSLGCADHQTLHCGGNEHVAKQCQALVAVAGFASRVTVDREAIGRERVLASGQVLVGTQPDVRLEVHRRGSGACMVKAKHQRVEHYAGLVHCPQTDDGIVYVRSNGKALWCGNTGEMNRHRAGWALSEGSMRFIRYAEGVPYWIPDSIKGGDVFYESDDGTVRLDFNDLGADVFVENGIHFFTGGVAGEAFPSDLEDLEQYPEEVQLAVRKAITRGAFRKAFGSQTTIYKIMERVWAKELAPTSKFKGKKEITSMMRRIVGMGVATGGMWSGNVRALRHVITMRAAPEAEEEILHVFARVAKMMRDREPLMFGDFTQDAQGFWRPKYRKV